MRTLIFSKFDNIYDVKSKPEEKTWKQWIDIFSKHEVRPCNDLRPEDIEKHKDGTCYVFGEIPKDGPHKNTSVLKAHAMVLDIDDWPDDKIEEGLDNIKDYEYFIYSTFSHQARYLEGDPDDSTLIKCTSKFRVILPLEKPVLPKHFNNCWKALDFLTNRISDRKTKNIGRLYYAPATFDEKKAIYYHNPGRWITQTELNEMPTTKRESNTYSMRKLKSLLEFLPQNETTANGLFLCEIRDKVCAEKPFAKKGTRHDAILGLTMYIAKRTGDIKPSIKLVRRFFKPSIEAMLEKDPSSPDLDDVERAYSGAIGKIKHYEEEIITEKARDKQLRGQDTYDEDLLHEIAKKQGWIPEDLDRRWIIQKGESFYFLGSDGGYKGPFTKGEARPAAATVLARAPILINEPTKTSYRRRGIYELVEEFGQVAQEVIVDLTLERSQFDAKNLVMSEAARPVRTDIVPKYNEDFDKCMRILAGDQYEKLLDWLACVPDLSKLLCALYLGGAPGSLKSGLAFGLARLWHKGPPAEIERILGDFTEDLVFCPLILVDEGLPKTWRGANITTKLRSMISTYQRTLARKYLPPATLVGAVRLILAANNEFLLKSTEVLSAADLQAVAQRFLYIEAPKEATNFVESLGPEVKQEWFNKDGIASHVLWLAKTREVVPGKRFSVEGDVSHMHRMLISGSDYNAMVCQWLVYYLMNTKPVDVTPIGTDALIKILDGQLLVNDQALCDGWSIFFPHSRIEPNVHKIGAALRAISTGQIIQRRHRNRRVRYRVVDLNNLFAWSENSNVGDRISMEETLGLREKEPEVAPIAKKVLPLADKLAKMKKKKEEGK
jgi:hypothetical protein